MAAAEADKIEDEELIAQVSWVVCLQVILYSEC